VAFARSVARHEPFRLSEEEPVSSTNSGAAAFISCITFRRISECLSTRENDGAGERGVLCNPRGQGAYRGVVLGGVSPPLATGSVASPGRTIRGPRRPALATRARGAGPPDRTAELSTTTHRSRADRSGRRGNARTGCW